MMFLHFKKCIHKIKRGLEIKIRGKTKGEREERKRGENKNE